MGEYNFIMLIDSQLCGEGSKFRVSSNTGVNKLTIHSEGLLAGQHALMGLVIGREGCRTGCAVPFQMDMRK